MSLTTWPEIATMADIGETGVDEQAAIILGHPGARMAVLTTGVRTQTPMETMILGSAALSGSLFGAWLQGWRSQVAARRRIEATAAA